MRTILPMVLILLLSAPLFADTLYLRNGSVLDGRVTRESDKSISFEVDGGEVDFNRTEILRVERNGKVDEPAPKKAAAPKPTAAKPAKPAGPRDLTKVEKPEMHFDDRQWKLGYQNATDTMLVAQFILENETIENWSEMVTAQLLFAEPTFSIENYVEKMKAFLLQSCATAKWNYIHRDSDEVMYVMSFHGCNTGPDQTEIARLIRGKDGVHALHYTAKTAELPEELKDQWVRLLQESKIVPAAN